MQPEPSVNSMLNKEEFLIIILGLNLLFFLLAYFSYKTYFQSAKVSLFTCIASLISSVFLILAPILFMDMMSDTLPFKNFNLNRLSMGIFIQVFIPRGLLPYFAIPLGVNLYRKWILNTVTEQEKIPGIDGVRTWLGVGNIICILGTALFYWLGFAGSFWIMLIGLLLATIAYPIINMFTHLPKPATKRDDLSQARERIFKLLEDGKISAEESKELLQALNPEKK